MEIEIMRQSKELQLGKAGEYMVCADLILKGFVAFPSEQGLPYDVILDVSNKILRVQVKTTESPRVIPQRNKETKSYIFNIKRSGKNGKTRYSNEEIDLFALVCVDTRKIGYLAADDMPETINIRVDKLRGTYYDEEGVKTYEKVMQMLKHTNFTQTKIALKLKKHISTINRMCKKGYKPYISKARYFSDFERNKEWFYEI